MRIKLPTTRKGRIWASVGTAVAVIAIVGGVGEATAPASDKQYKVCMEAYHDAKHCYEDVYNHRTPNTPPTSTPSPTNTPSTPVSVPSPTSWNPQPAQHFFFYPDADLDTSEVIDLR